MLREIDPARQVPGEGKRRWFTSANIDLFVWVNEGGLPTGFQLCYDKQLREYALTWTEEFGFSHMAVDGGESRPGRYKGAPILVANGTIDLSRVMDEFRLEATNLPDDVARIVEAKVELLQATLGQEES